jgi:tetratricopeptide (TPR) repeat protein
LCHRAHTIPFLSSGKPEAEEILRIDVLAMADLVDLLHQCYLRNNISANFPEALSFLENSISDLRWKEVMNYQRALWYLADKNDRNNAYREISKIDIESCDYPEALTLYLDVVPEEISFTDKQIIIDRIIQNTTKESYILQYTTLKGVTFCLIGEVDKGCEIIESAINNYKEIDESSHSGYGDFLLAQALETLGEFRNDKEIINEAIERYKKEIDEKVYSSAGIAMLLKSVGDCYLFISNYSTAINYYETSLVNEEKDLTRVFLSRALVNNGAIAEGSEILSTIEIGKFNDANRYDYAISWAILAFVSLEKNDIETAKSHLKEAKSSDQLFIRQRDKYLIELLELNPKEEKGKFLKALSKLNRYVTLNPNFCGLGLNLNNIIEDIETKTKK